jgi:calcium-dependent protein kinase
LTETIGSAYYIAPEVLKGSYNYKCDLWSAGVICFMLLSGGVPFGGTSEAEILRKVESGNYEMKQGWQSVSDQAKEFVRALMNVDVEARLSAQQALEHPWIVKNGSLMPDEAIAIAALDNIKKFKCDKVLRSATFSYIASQLIGKRERDLLSTAFRFFNKSNDGRLTKEQLREAYTHYKRDVTDEELDTLFASMDTDKSGSISFSEFLTASMTERSLTGQDKLQSAFRMFDKDGSGLVSAEELA